MIKWFLGLGLLMVCGFSWFIYKNGIPKQPAVLIKPTLIDSKASVGAVSFHRLRQEIRERKVLVLGSSPFVTDSQKVWEGLLKVAAANGWKADHIFEQRGLPGIKGFKTSSFKNKKNLDLSAYKEKRIVIHAVASDVYSNKYDSVGELQMLIHPVRFTKEKIEDLYPPCDNTHPMSCKAEKFAWKYAHRDLDEPGLGIGMEAIESFKFLLFLRDPQPQSREPVSFLRHESKSVGW